MANEDRDQIQTTLRFESEFHERVRIHIARKRLRSIQQAVVLALEQWMAAPASASSAPAPPPEGVPAFCSDLSEAETEQVKQLLRICRDGNDEQKMLVTGFLTMMELRVRTLGKKKAG